MQIIFIYFFELLMVYHAYHYILEKNDFIDYNEENQPEDVKLIIKLFRLNEIINIAFISIRK